jgi:hypothetical protein
MPKKHEDISLRGFGALCNVFIARLAKVAERMSPDLMHNWARNGDAIERLLMQMIPPSEQELAEAQAVVRSTVNGRFRKDRSGLWHYAHTSMGTVYSAAHDAIDYRPAESSWFWFNDTPAPMYTSDSIGSLVGRWSAWRTAIQSGLSSNLVDFLLELSTE